MITEFSYEFLECNCVILLVFIEGKTKDNTKSKEDLKLLCKLPSLAKNHQISKYPQAYYAIDKQLRDVLC